jgi:hypothetical protein
MASTAARRRWASGLALLVGAGLALLTSSCYQDGQLTILGYTTGSNYDRNIKTVRVPIFQNRTFYQGLEFELTNELVRAIDKVTPYRVVQCDADTELTGIITNFSKTEVLANPENEARLVEVVMTVELTWKDLRSGEILTKPVRRPGTPVLEFEPPKPTPERTPEAEPAPPQEATIAGPVSDTGALPPFVLPPEPKVVPGVAIKAVARYVPELGGSMAVGQQQASIKMAARIVSLMEKPW